MINQSGGVSKHLKDVPSQITCRLLNLVLKSKKDFVYALLLLEPEPNVRRFDFVHIFPLNRLFS